MIKMIKVETKEKFWEELEKHDKVLAIFYASWCPYCMAFVPVFEVQTGGFDNGTVIHVMLDDYDNPLWDEYEIGAVPTVIFFEKSKITNRLDGKNGVGLTEKQLKEWLQKIKPS